MILSNVKVLQSGIRANEALPGSQTDVLTKETDKFGLVLLISFRAFF